MPSTSGDVDVLVLKIVGRRNWFHEASGAYLRTAWPAPTSTKCSCSTRSPASVCG